MSITPRPRDETTGPRPHPYLDADDAHGYCSACWLPARNWRHNDDGATVTEALALAVAADPLHSAAGRLCVEVLDRHSRRADDGACDSCAVAWPCVLVLSVVDLIREAH